MSKYAERNGVAVGLVLGISLTLNFIIWSLAGFAWVWSEDSKPYSNTYAEAKCAEQKIDQSTGEIPVLKSKDSNAAAHAADDPNTNQNGNPEQPNWCDLASQESMAKSTYWMNKAAWAAIALSSVGVWLIWRTLAATKNTLKATQDMANSQFDIGNREIQPQIFLSDMEAVFDGKGQRRVIMTVVNSGATAGKNLWVNYKFHFFDENNKEIEQIVTAGGANKVGSLFPSQTLNLQNSFQSWPKCENIQVRAEVRYENPNTRSVISDTFMFTGKSGISKLVLRGTIED